MTKTQKPKRLQARESKAFKRQKFTWLGWVKDFIKAHELPPSAYLYAAHYSDKFNEERGGMAWEGCGETAKAIGMNKSSVVRLQHRFVELGLFIVEWGKQGKGHSTRCWMALKGAPVHLSKGAKRCAAKGASEHAKGAPVQMTLSKNLSMKTSKEVFHRRERASELRSPPPAGAGGIEAAAPSEEIREDAAKEKGGEKNVVTTISRSQKRPPMRQTSFA